ncbi:MAG TPA: baseplate J/gp47 family protein [Candidatus Sulfomarinibacteraceae bacterium]|nr:baseplate J/gp47 family protein [Candidatus Sulfomarinibacteraceae bacterium]
MAAIVYLDVDDEITSAAARIRGLPDGRIALVLPLGSRLATSRINFRLLAREAEAHGKVIEVVTNDASARALAASAGLPTHVSVAAFEGGPSAAGRSVAAGPEGPGPAAAAGTARGMPRPPVSIGATDDSPTLVAPVPKAIQPPVERSAAVPQVGRRPPRPRGPILVAVLLLVGLVAAGGSAAFLLLPSAQIVLVPATQTVGPIELNVTAQLGVTEPDPANLLVPATHYTFEVEVSNTFPASGLKVTETAATVEVIFSSLNTGGSNTIRAGSIVRTESGIEFRTLAEVQLPAAQIGIVNNEFVIIPSTRKVEVEAVVPGTSGNVAANTIVIVPEGENPIRTLVRNEVDASGGTYTESPQIEQSDVDEALRLLRDALVEAFDERLAGATDVPEGTTLFPETRSLGPTTPSVDPATLVGAEFAEFELGLAATGSVLGVDPGPVSTLADARVRGAVDDGLVLDEASISIVVGDPIVAGSIVTFPVTVRAVAGRVVDADALLARVRGLALPQARTVLGEYGEVRISVWPDWVTTIPTAGGRATLTVEAPAVDGAAP